MVADNNCSYKTTFEIINWDNFLQENTVSDIKTPDAGLAK